jgi:hypothetical protein
VLAAVTLRRGLGADPATLDPRLAEDNAALAIAADLYEGLTRESADGSIIPNAAQSWSIEDGGLTPRAASLQPSPGSGAYRLVRRVPDGIPGYAPTRFEWQDLPYPQTVTRARALADSSSLRQGPDKDQALHERQRQPPSRRGRAGTRRVAGPATQ